MSLPDPTAAPGATGAPQGAEGEREVVERLKGGDEQTFLTLFADLHASLVQVARSYVSRADLAEEVAQETWLAVSAGIGRFQSRSALRTWIFAILVKRALRTAKRERLHPGFHGPGRQRPDEGGQPAAPRTIRPSSMPLPGEPGTPAATADPESLLLDAEADRALQAAIASLPPLLRAVLTLRDVEGHTNAEICELLCLSAENQRVILHRARTRVRRAVEPLLPGDR